MFPKLKILNLSFHFGNNSQLIDRLVQFSSTSKRSESSTSTYICNVIFFEKKVKIYY